MEENFANNVMLDAKLIRLSGDTELSKLQLWLHTSESQYSALYKRLLQHRHGAIPEVQDARFLMGTILSYNSLFNKTQNR